MDLFVILRILSKKFKMIVGITLITAVIAGALSLFMKPLYVSTAQIATGYTMRDGLSNERRDWQEIDFSFANLIHNLYSKNLLYQLSYQLILHDLNKGIPSFRELDISEEKFNEKFGSNFLEEAKIQFQNKYDSSKTLSNAVAHEKKLNDLLKLYGYDYEALKKGFEIDRMELSDFVNVSFWSENPDLCAFATNTLCQEFFKFNRDARLQSSGETIVYYEKMMEQKKSELDEKQSTLSRYMSNQGVLSYNLESEYRMQQIEKLEMTRNEEERNLRANQLTLNSVNERIIRLETMSGNRGATSQTRLLDLKNQINEQNRKFMQTQSEEDYEILARLREQERQAVAAVSESSTVKRTQELDQLRDRKKELEILVEVSGASVSDLNDKISRLKSAASSLSTKEGFISELQSEIEFLTNEYLGIKERLNDARSSIMYSGGNLRQTLYGQPSDEPEPSNRIIIVALSAIAVFFISVISVVGKEVFNSNIVSPDRFRQMTGLQTYGVVNQIPSLKNVTDIFTKADNIHLRQYMNNMRKIRYDMVSSGKKVILFTSMKEGEGKSFFMLSLALALLKIKKKVLILDTNFQNDQLLLMGREMGIYHEKIDAESENGQNPFNIKQKSNYTGNGSAIENINHSLEAQQEAFHDEDEDLMLTEGDEVATQTAKKVRIDLKNALKIEKPEPDASLKDINGNHFTNDLNGMNMISCKDKAKSPSEFFADFDFKELLEKQMEAYDYIFMEGAAMNEYPDTKELEVFVQGIIPVISAKSTITSIDKESLLYIQNFDKKLLGTVLNMVSIEDLNY
jgi:polysaccharide biosynthesis transport protein